MEQFRQEIVRTHPAASRLDLTRIAFALQDSPVGHTLDYQVTVPSTMPLAHALAEQPSTRSGTLVVAEEQTAGLGRLQRHWEAPAAQALLVSLILKGEHLPANPAQLPMLAGVAMVQALVRLEPELVDEIGLKWPNDLLLGDDLATGRKTAGILIETSYLRNQMQYAIVGMGINVNQEEAQLPAVPAGMPLPTSLLVHLGRTVDRSELLITLSKVWSELLNDQRTGQDIFYQWRALLYTLGQPVTVRLHGDATGGLISGRAVDVTPDGELVVHDDGGHLHVFSAGDVTSRLAA